MELAFQFATDGQGSTRLDEAFGRYWPAYGRWIARSRTRSLRECVKQLGQHMPELLPTFESLLARFGGSDGVGRFLTLYNPPRVVRGCTQIMLESESGPVLLRSYDHHPALFDGLILRSDWAGVATLAMTDCIWGALDGINSSGLVVALAFGGRNVIGDGFAAPLICRYVLETCTTVAEARGALSRLPVYMPYTFAVVDASGRFVTAFLGPDAEATFIERRCSTNHQARIDWPEYARFVETAERLALIEPLVGPTASIEHSRDVFLSPPVWRTHYARGSGTLYVAEYTPALGTLKLHWPARAEQFSLGDGQDRQFSVSLRELSIK